MVISENYEDLVFKICSQTLTLKNGKAGCPPIRLMICIIIMQQLAISKDLLLVRDCNIRFEL